jgi:23S rRNA G2445 N2-methylase RlmL
MQYKFATQQIDYSDFSSGRVFYSLPGHPAFPVRLASEVFQRCMTIRAANGDTAPCVLYDPCCGAAYQLGVLAYLHAGMIGEVIGSDIDERAVSLAAQNLGLLTPAGLDKRIDQITELFSQYGKPSHKAALESARLLRERLGAFDAPKVRAFRANALDADALRERLGTARVDIVLTDVPYGQHSQWQDANANPIYAMLDALLGILLPTSIVAIASDKQQKVAHERYRRLERFQIGKRQVVILRPAR